MNTGLDIKKILRSVGYGVHYVVEKPEMER